MSEPDTQTEVIDNQPESNDFEEKVMDNSSETHNTEEKVIDNSQKSNDTKETKHQRIMEKVKASGWDSLEPCEKCFNATLCEKCCATCTEPCNAQQPCRKKDVKPDTKAKKEDVSEPDTQESQNKERDLEWHKDIMRMAVVDIATACAAIRKYSTSGTDCCYCPLYNRNACTLVAATPKSVAYMMSAKRRDKKLERLFRDM